MSAALAGGGSSPPPAPCKGKAKMDDEAEAEGAGKMCGICYVDGRRAIPGELDCCAHFFCFVCIMAWGRVESRCPFCKARFRTIRRPPVPGRFPDERVVSVPERNQVYHPQGNGSSTVGRDPYSDIVCTVCNASRDDELLLLCELCDSAAHTYCAGLGNVVPEGDWFCKDCAIIREEQLRWQAENEGQGSQAEFEINIDVPRAEPVAAPPVSEAVDEEYAPDRTDVRGGSNSMDDPVPSIYDIVGEDFPTCAGIRMGPRRNAPSQGSSPDGSQGPVLTKARDGGLAAYHARIRQEVERARTLRNSRNLDKRVRELRENWAALRAGSVGFAPRVPNAVNNRNGGAATSVQPQMPSPAETSTSLGNGKKVLHKDTRDARKAWKKLEMAKTSGGRKISSKPASLDCTASFSMGNRSTSYSPIDTILGHKNGNLPNKVTRQNNANCGQGTKMESTPPTKDSGECHRLSEDSHARVHERMISFQNRINQESLNGNVASSIHGQHVDQPLASSCSTGRSEKFKSGTLHLLKCSSSSGQSPVPKSQKLEPISGSQSNMMVNAEEPLSAATTNEIGSAAATNEIGSAAPTEVTKSSRPERHEHKRKHSSEKSKDEGSKRSRSACKTAKSEISSLAIRELKLLKIDKTHGSEKFKEVARTATHTVLAACGFEHSPSQSLALPRPVCKHSPKVKQLNSSGLADSCRECLRSSVKEAISLALSGRHMDQTSASC